LFSAPLSYNGGPTRTHALPAGSLAIDSGPLSGFPATDQRGVGPAAKWPERYRRPRKFAAARIAGELHHAGRHRSASEMPPTAFSTNDSGDYISAVFQSTTSGTARDGTRRRVRVTPASSNFTAS
jgi:hypothetical protein